MCEVFGAVLWQIFTACEVHETAPRRDGRIELYVKLVKVVTPGGLAYRCHA